MGALESRRDETFIFKLISPPGYAILSSIWASRAPCFRIRSPRYSRRLAAFELPLASRVKAVSVMEPGTVGGTESPIAAAARIACVTLLLLFSAVVVLPEPQRRRPAARHNFERVGRAN